MPHLIRRKLAPKFSPIHEDPAPVETSRGAVPPLVLRIVTRLWIALLIIGSLQPARPGLVTGVHREIHWLAFAGGALLLFLLSTTRRQEILRAFAIFFLGLSLEVLQRLI